MALTLALSLASVAFAADADITATTDMFTDGDLTSESDLIPGETYSIEETNIPIGTDLTSANFKVSASWKTGSALVDSVKIKDNELQLILKENYTISSAKTLKGTITLTCKKAAGVYEKDDVITIAINESVTNKIEYITGESKLADSQDAPVEDVANNTIYICEEDEGGYVTFNSTDSLLQATLKMKSEEKVFAYVDEEMLDDIDEEYGDLDADIYCYNFVASPSLSNSATLTLQADYYDQYNIYAWNGSKLTEVDADFNSEDGVYEWTTKKLTAYIISDTELDASSDDTDTDTDADTDTDSENPDTGAHDVVGVAAALAVVSLIAAGAVSVKKN